MRTVPGQGKVIYPIQDDHAKQVIEQGLWSNSATFGERNGAMAADWQVKSLAPDGSSFEVYHHDKWAGKTEWALLGQHNLLNAVACLAAAHDVGVPPAVTLEALSLFKSVKRRLELKADIHGIKIYDDFAHHPTAIKLTLDGLRAKVGKQKIHVCMDLRSNTMKMGVHQNSLAASLMGADTVSIYKTSDVTWPVEAVAQEITQCGANHTAQVYTDIASLIDNIKSIAKPNEHILIMSNGSFEGIHQKLIASLG